jgi:hypothetical protein
MVWWGFIYVYNKEPKEVPQKRFHEMSAYTSRTLPNASVRGIVVVNQGFFFAGK